MKQLSFILILFATTLMAVAQQEITRRVSSQEESRLYIKGYLDYGIAMPNSFKGIPDVNTNTLMKNSLKGWGQGLKVGLGAGYIINDFINFGLDIDYYLSPKISSEKSAVNSESKAVFDAQIVALTPNITFKAIQNVDFYPYSRVGVTIGLPFGMTNTVDNTVLVGGKKNFIQSVYNYKSGPAFGYLAALGVRKSLTPGFKLFAEIQANNLTIQPKTASLTSYQENGTDQLSTLTVAQKEIQFTDNVSNANNPNQATQQNKTPFLISRICIQFGLTFRF